jgi:hypothetical protein
MDIGSIGASDNILFGDLSQGSQLLLDLLYDGKVVYVWKRREEFVFGQRFPFRDDTAFVYGVAHLNELLSAKFVVVQVLSPLDDIILQVQVTMRGAKELLSAREDRARRQGLPTWKRD